MKKGLFLFISNSIFIWVSAQPTPTQNVGIGTASPTRAKLEVHGAVGATNAIFGGETSGISLQSNWPGIGFNQYYNNGSRYIATGFAAAQFVDPNSGYMAFDMFGNGTANNGVTSSKRAMVITNNGRVNIGSADLPPATLNVARGNASDGTAVFQGTTHRSHFNYAGVEDTYIRGGINGSRVIINDIPGGNVVMGNGASFVGINSGNPFYALEVKQTNNTGLLLVHEISFNNWELKVTNAEVSGATANLSLWYNQGIKGIFRPTNGEYNALSDRRLKKNISPIPSLLDKVMKLKPVVFEMKDQNTDNESTFGFIAQDVKLLFPQLVGMVNNPSFTDKGMTDLHTLSYSSFGILAIKAIQEQQQQIEILKKELAELKKLILSKQ